MNPNRYLKRFDTLVNTGCKGGVIKRLEDHLNKPVQWLVCLLHTNEIPFCHLMKELDGGTGGPDDFGGLTHYFPDIAYVKIFLQKLKYQLAIG